MQEFVEWLIEKKGFSEKGARDVVCRKKRVNVLLDKKAECEEITLEEIENNANYKSLSSFVKSQLKRAITLYSEYSSEKIH